MESQEPDWLTPAKLSEAEELRRYLKNRDAWCPACHYNLRGLTASRCPECGCGLRLGIRATEPFLRAWIFLALVTFAGSGVSVLFYVILIQGAGWRSMPNIGRFVFVFILTAPLQSGAAIMFRRRFVRLSETMQWFIGAGALVVWVAALLAFFNSV